MNDSFLVRSVGVRSGPVRVSVGIAEQVTLDHPTVDDGISRSNPTTNVEHPRASTRESAALARIVPDVPGRERDLEACLPGWIRLEDRALQQLSIRMKRSAQHLLHRSEL